MKNVKTRINIIVSIAIMLSLVLLDQLTKLWAVVGLKNKPSFVLIPNVFELSYLENQSAAFGIDLITIIQKIFKFQYFIEHPDAFLRAKMIFFIVVTFVVVILLFLLYLRIPNTKRFFWANLTVILFISGAIGNVIDRAWHNYVVDFFYFSLINFPVFNVADIYVTVAAFIIIVLGIFYYKEEDYEVIFPSKKDKIRDAK